MPVLSRFCISGARIQGSNGRVVIDAPCAELKDIEALIPADRFLSAVDACGGEPLLSLTSAGRLAVKRDKFHAHLPVQPVESFPRAQPSDGKKVKRPTPLLPGLQRLRPFIGEDSTRPWCLTIFSDGEFAYATNSAMMARVPANKLKFQLPVFLIDELLRIGDEPTQFAQDDHSITFFYGDAWLRSQLIVDEWPVLTAQKLLTWDTKVKALPETLIAAIESIVPFCNDPKLPVIHFTPNGVSTAPGETQAEVQGAGWPPLAFDARNLLPMLRASSRFGIDLESGRGLFEGEGGFRGVMAGQRVQTPTPAPGQNP